MSDEYRAPDGSASVIVYQYGKGFLWFVFLGSAGFVAVLGWWLLSDPTSGSDSLGAWCVAIVFLGCGILFFGTGVLFSLFLLIRQKPFLMLDSRGLECAQGSVRWSEVERVVEVVRTADGWTLPSLRFVVQPEWTPSPPTRAYLGSIGGRGIVGDWIDRRGGLRRLGRFRASIGGKYSLPNLPSPVLELSIWQCRRQVLDAIDRFYAGAVPTVRFEDLASELVPS